MRKKIFFSLLLLLAVLLIGGYIVQVNALTALAYRTAETERAIQNLKEETAALEIHVHQGTPAFSLESLASRLGFERVQTISYIKPIPAAVARQSP